MDETLKDLYGSFYMPLEMAKLKRAVESNRTLLREKVQVEGRKLVQRIVRGTKTPLVYDTLHHVFSLALIT